jgi:hypothetical protein
MHSTTAGLPSVYDQVEKYMIRILCIFFFSSFSCISTWAERESYFQQSFAEKCNGKTEVVMTDGTRCDILTEDYAMEVDFAHKWAEAIGQSLNYARLTGKRAGIVLIIKRNKDEHHLDRVLKIIESYNLPIDIFSIYTK